MINVPFILASQFCWVGNTGLTLYLNIFNISFHFLLPQRRCCLKGYCYWKAWLLFNFPCFISHLLFLTRPGFLYLSNVDIWSWITFFFFNVGNVLQWTAGYLAAFLVSNPIYASRSPAVTITNVSNTAKCLLGAKLTLVKNHWSRYPQKFGNFYFLDSQIILKEYNTSWCW